jgi:hypothetical protein
MKFSTRCIHKTLWNWHEFCENRHRKAVPSVSVDDAFREDRCSSMRCVTGEPLAIVQRCLVAQCGDRSMQLVLSFGRATCSRCCTFVSVFSALPNPPFISCINLLSPPNLSLPSIHVTSSLIHLLIHNWFFSPHVASPLTYTSPRLVLCLSFCLIAV